MNERVKKWTPGPWVVVGDDYAPWGVVRVCSHRFIRPEGRSFDEAKANAHLVSAAPALVEALEAAIDCGMVPISSAKDGGASRHSRQVQVADQIRAALAMAYGETGGEE